MDATQNVNLDEGGESVQTSAGLNSANSASLEMVDSGGLLRAEENPVANMPTLSISRTDQVAIDGLNAMSDGEVYEEARDDIDLHENLAANHAEAAKTKEVVDKQRKKSALETQLSRLEATNAPGKADDRIVSAVRSRLPTLANLESRYKNAVEDLNQELLGFFQK